MDSVIYFFISIQTSHTTPDVTPQNLRSKLNKTYMSSVRPTYNFRLGPPLGADPAPISPAASSRVFNTNAKICNIYIKLKVGYSKNKKQYKYVILNCSD
jgi:hypothetical protein